MLTVIFASCGKDDGGEDVQPFNEVESRVPDESIALDPSTEYYLRGKKIDNEDEIKNLLETSMHTEIDGNVVTFYPTLEEQNERLAESDEETGGLTSKAKRSGSVIIVMHGKHNKKNFIHLATSNYKNYGAQHSSHHFVKKNKSQRAKSTLFKKVNRKVSILNHSNKEADVIFYSKKNFKGQSTKVKMYVYHNRQNNSISYHVGSHKINYKK